MAARLRKLREDQNTSQDHIANVAKVSQATWSAWEEKTPKQFEALERLVRKYGVSADYLLGITDDPRPAATRGDLSETVTELIEVVVDMPVSRQQDILAVARALEAEDRDAEQMREYDRMMELLERIGGVDAVEALEAALRADAAGDAARASLLIEAFFAGRDAKVSLQEERKNA